MSNMESIALISISAISAYTCLNIIIEEKKSQISRILCAVFIAVVIGCITIIFAGATFKTASKLQTQITQISGDSEENEDTENDACENTECKHRCKNDCCDTKINSSGKISTTESCREPIENLKNLE